MKYISQVESRMFSSLANPKRIEILHILQHGPASVGQIVEMTGIPQANVSQHLSVMRRQRLVICTKEAQSRRYNLASSHLLHVFHAMRGFLLERYGVKDIEKLDSLHVHVDPVCGMELAPHQVVLSHVFEHRRFYFCGKGCAKRFLHAPRVFVEVDEPRVAP